MFKFEADIEADVGADNLPLSGSNMALGGPNCALRQVMINLILNARHSMQNGGGTLRISACEDAAMTRIEIEDTGCGITPEKLQHIFTPFYTDGKKNGNGLGLAYCQKVVEAHGGCISAESEPGRGTRFRIGLPKSAP